MKKREVERAEQGAFEVPGFSFGTATAGLKESGAPDIGLIVASRPVAAGGVFTRNRFRAAPVDLAVQRLTAGRLRALVVNSGNANACTGPRGRRDAQAMCVAAAACLGIAPSDVAPASTGLIGAPLAMGKVQRGIRAAARSLRPSGAADFADAIRTTDAFAKIVATTVPGRDGPVRILGIAKGAGMIAPEMATLLVFVLSDADLFPLEARRVARAIAGSSFNELSVDGDTSTNDSLFVLASGAARLRRTGRRLPENFLEAAKQIGRDLAVLVARDGEGATKVVHLEVRGAANEAEARQVARTVSRSTLVKAAFHGADPNWGRIACAIGYSGVAVDPERVSIAIGGVPVFAGGVGVAGSRARARRRMQASEVEVVIELGRGQARAGAITSDLSPAYVKFNSAYST
ncbi:MAG: bifunctional glutamate N-acetyltransferase/amino-acid acetyltransferase ArgJ [Deltaproteobacteria bacterium]